LNCEGKVLWGGGGGGGIIKELRIWETVERKIKEIHLNSVHLGGQRISWASIQGVEEQIEFGGKKTITKRKGSLGLKRRGHASHVEEKKREGSNIDPKKH